MNAPRIVDAEGVFAACGPAAAVWAVTAALRTGFDPATDLPRHGVPVGSGQLLLMPSDGAAHVGVKVVTMAPDNPARGLPRVQASYLMFDARSLGLVAVLDGTALTTLRTPAVSVAAVAHRLTGPGPVSVVVFGAGPQAHGHVETLAAVLAPRALRVTVIARDPARAVPPGGAAVVAAGDPAASDALRAADVVVCATSARTPLFDADLIADAAVVIAVGSHEPDARELPAALCARATVVVEDVATALREAGDVCLAIGENALRPADLVPMRDVVTGRTVPALDRPLVFKSVGMSWEDLVVAEAVLRRIPP
ncbi:ornithine cyclodeaminase family protein [Virgisporangium aurantiacum]|uniref:Ornithine cyclodeaminase n=1 Tax=Virgisporangium aurantiacum TaxID=175570 RepID=A0A8J3Z738_9ACTN|nr:ornithine cyclodeaminase family protein [Virgisporangium aurantiacum]GIJ56451.1 ornithine cyclodeaminase [Virgisporangium aurantiacum]